MATARAQRGPYAKGIERRAAIVQIAIEVFGTRGFRGATLQEVAARAGVSASAIIKLFGSKEQLLIAVLERWDIETAEVIGADRSGLDLLEGFCRLMRYHEQHPGLLQLYITMAAESATEDHPAQSFMRQRYERTLASMRNLFAEAAAVGAICPLGSSAIAAEAAILLSTMDGLELQYVVDPRSALADTFAAYVDALTLRLKATETSASHDRETA